MKKVEFVIKRSSLARYDGPQAHLSIHLRWCIVMYLGRVVEAADAEALYDNPLHPYAKALLSAVPISDPKADAGRERIKLIGEIPSVLERSPGCPLCERCQHATERCKTQVPQLKRRGDGQMVACFLYE